MERRTLLSNYTDAPVELQQDLKDQMNHKIGAIDHVLSKSSKVYMEQKFKGHVVLKNIALFPEIP